MEKRIRCRTQSRGEGEQVRGEREKRGERKRKRAGRKGQTIERERKATTQIRERQWVHVLLIFFYISRMRTLLRMKE